MNTLEVDRLLMRLKKADTNEKKAELYADLSAEARELADYYKQQNPDYIAPFEIKSDGSF
jgi:hypothetical protein